jgi:hypothetical protein
MIYYLLVLMFSVGLLALFVTQVALPFYFGTPFFPLFRKKDELSSKIVEAEIELTETTELVNLQEQLEELNRRKAELEKK